jgi:hypothetical protein
MRFGNFINDPVWYAIKPVPTGFIALVLIK